MRKVPVLWQESALWQPLIQMRQPQVALEKFFIGMPELSASMATSMPPIILTPKTSHEYEFKEI